MVSLAVAPEILQTLGFVGFVLGGLCSLWIIPRHILSIGLLFGLAWLEIDGTGDQ